MAEPSRAPTGSPRVRAIAALIVLAGLGGLIYSAREAPKTQALEPVTGRDAAPEEAGKEQHLAPAAESAVAAEAQDPQPGPEPEQGVPPARNKHLTKHQVTTRIAASRRAASGNHEPADVLLVHAEEALDTGNHQRALDLARQAQHSRKSPVAYSIEAQALCHQGDGPRAQRAYDRITGPLKEQTRGACDKAGIVLQ